jgi:hypothetical protein
MAYGEEVAREIPRAFMIHVWPTAELIAESWGWPESWHTAYAQIAWTLGLAAATQVLEGGSFDGQTSEFCPPIGCVRFTIAQAGTTIHITISDFAGPHAPGPNGGIGQQPTTIGGLVLGLREANGYFHVVVFHGAAPEVPASGRTSTDISYNIDGTSFVVRANEVLPVVNYLEPILQSISDEAVFCYIGCDCPDASQDALRREIRGSASTLDELRSEPRSRDLKIQLVEPSEPGKDEMKGFDLFCRISEENPSNRDLPIPDVYLQSRQRQMDQMPGHDPR